MWRIKSKTETIATDNPIPNLTIPKLTQFLETVYPSVLPTKERIAQFYYEHVSQRRREAKSISIWKLTPTPWTDAGVHFVSGEQYIISIKDSDGNVLASAHASMTYTMWRIKSETETYATDNTSSELNVTSRNPNWPSPTKTQYLYPSTVECFAWGMRRTVCALYIESWEYRLCNRKHIGISQWFFEDIFEWYGEAKFI